MIWPLIAAGLVFVLCLVFVLALCAAAAAGDRISASIDYDSPTWHDGYLTGHAEASVFELDGTYKRPRAADTAEGMTEDR